MFGVMPNRLHQNASGHAIGSTFHELHGEAAADAVAHEKELLDPKVVHQAELVIGERAPRVTCRDGATGLTAVRVALIHRDAAELVLENLHRVENGGGPVADA